VPFRGRDVLTSIFKSPVIGRVRIVRHNVEGDQQADSRVHGGEYKAVYAYSAEHYPWWRNALGRELEPASFGENLTISDFDESAVAIGDVFRVGDAELEAAGPRLPCYKLGVRFGDPLFVKTFVDAGRWGVYFRVRKEGSAEAGDTSERIHADPANLKVYDIARVYFAAPGDRETLERLAGHPRLDPSWREHFAAKLGVAP
jgi:MOSC domain-containing protein YiiM